MLLRSDKTSPNAPKSPLRDAAAAILIGLAVGVSLTVSLRLITGNLHLNFHAKAPHSGESAAERLADEQESLARSIVAVLQEQYVDADRVNATVLTDIAIDTISGLAESTASREGATISVTHHGSDLSLAVPHTPDEAAEMIATIARFLTENAADPDHPEVDAFTFLNDILNRLDPHSSLLTSDEYEELREGTEGEFGGLGIVVGIRDRLLTVLKPMPRSPAARAGIRGGDKILDIDGRDTYGANLDEIVSHMRGAPGSAVRMTIQREGLPRPLELVVARDVITVDSARRRIIPLGTDASALVINLESFSERTAEEVREALDWGRRQGSSGFSGVILDLRGNPGGLLDQAVATADLWLREGVIVSTRGREKEVETAKGRFAETDYPIITLIDGDSASAAEILAGALQDHGRALVIGQPSFGKASVQTVFELPRQQALKVTVARYYTPSGRSIQNTGIMPDIWAQPVFTAKENMNLLGARRYKGERSLRHHLSVVNASEVSPRTPLLKSYYLASEPRDADAEPSAAADKNDRELGLALQVLKKIRAVYPRRLPEGAQRATHWMALAGKDIVGSLDQAETQTLSWLNQRLNIDWSFGGTPPSAPELALSVPDKTLYPGEEFDIHWTLRSTADHPLARVSLYTESSDWMFETRELLIGTLAPRAERSGKLRARVPLTAIPGHMPFNVGVAIEAEPLSDSVRALSATIGMRDMPHLVATARLDDSTSQGREPETLEAGEEALLRVTMRNDGNVTTEPSVLRVRTLADTDASLPSKEISVPSLRPGETWDTSVPIRGERAISATSVHLGLDITSPQLEDGFHLPVSIDTRPGVFTRPTARDNNTPALAH